MVASVPPAPRLMEELDFKVIKEQWLTIKLKDGSTIKFRAILMRIFETDATNPTTGEPVYFYEGHNVVVVKSPEDLQGTPSERLPDPSEALKMPKEEVEVIETIDPSWNLYELDGGKRIKSKPVITNVHKIKGVFDQYRHPYYVVLSQMVVGSSPLQLQPPEPSAETVGETWPSLPRFLHKHHLPFDTPPMPPDLTLGMLLPDWTIPPTTPRDRWIEKQKNTSIENFLDDIHKMVRGRFKDWKEEEHLADKLLFRLAKGEE